MHIEPAQPADLGAILALECAVDPDQNHYATPAYVQQALGQQKVYVAREDNKVIGFIDMATGISSIWVSSMAVDEGYRKNNIGRSLIEFAKEVARERNKPCLRLFPLPEAEGFYRKCGFEKVPGEIVFAHFI